MFLVIYVGHKNLAITSGVGVDDYMIMLMPHGHLPSTERFPKLIGNRSANSPSLVEEESVRGLLFTILQLPLKSSIMQVTKQRRAPVFSNTILSMLRCVYFFDARTHNPDVRAQSTTTQSRVIGSGAD